MADLGEYFDANLIPNFGPDFDALPDLPAFEELKSFRQWVAWTWTRRETASGWKWTKPPISPLSGHAASISNPLQWSSYERASAAVEQRDLAGVGFVLTERDPFIGIDLDKCRDPISGAIDDWALDILALTETYAEISPSETGIRLLARGGLEKATKWDAAHVEVYDRARYVTVTGRHIDGTPTEIHEAPRTIDALLTRVAQFKADAEPPPVPQPVPNAAAPHTPSAGHDFFRTVNNLALATLEVWVPALFSGARGSGQKGYRISSRQLGRDLEEDLSITPAGAVDFGVHDMGDARDGKRTPIDLVLEYGGAPNATDAALWLCDRLHREPADLGWDDPAELARIGAEIAEGIEEQRIGALNALSVEEAEMLDSTGARLEVDPSGIPIFPAHLLDVPGLAGDVADWIVRSAENPQPVLAMGAALTLVGALMGRRWFGPTGSSAVLYVLALAPTGAGKERPRQALFDLLSAANLQSAVGASNFTSSMAIEKAVIRHPITVNRLDEIGAFLKKVLGKRASNYELEMAKLMRELWGINSGTWQSIERAQSSAQSVLAPHFSIFATGVPAEVFEAIGSGDLSNGTVNRFLLMPAGRSRDAGLPDLSEVDPPKHLVAQIKAITAQERDGLADRWTNPALLGAKSIIPFASKEVEAAYVGFKREVTAQLGGSGDFRARTVEVAIRLAAIRAFSLDQDRPIVTMDDLVWAIELASWSANAMERMCADQIAENETQRLANKVRTAIRELGGTCSHSILLRKLKNSVRARDLDETIELLASGGYVSVTIGTSGDKGGRRPKSYTLARQ